MSRFMRFLTSMETGFSLLIIASGLLFSGAIIADLNSTPLRALNIITFQEWFPEYCMHPLLYVWMLLLFGALSLLAVNTFLCTIVYVRNMSMSGISTRKWGVIMFHFCFLIFLSGHFLYGFTGICERVVVEQDIPSSLPALGLSILPFSIEKNVVTIYGQEIPMATEAGIVIAEEEGRKATIQLATLRPRHALGYSFHVSVREKGLTRSQIGIIVRKQYGLNLFIVGGVIALMAIALSVPGLLRSRGL